MAKRTCSIEGCEKPHAALGWCHRHYYRLRARGECSVVGCGDPVDVRGWCSLHYRRWLRTGTLDPPAALWGSVGHMEEQPPVVHEEITAGDLEVGMAGEHLVVADLLLRGYRAVMAEQHCPYDVLVELNRRFVRVQVKSVRGPSTEGANQRQPAYIWGIRRAGKGRQRVYGADQFDLLACVALDRRLIAYIPEAVAMQHVQVRVPGWVPPGVDVRGYRAVRKEGRQFANLTFESAVAAL